MVTESQSLIKLIYDVALRHLTTEEILQLQQVAVETSFDYKQVRKAFVKVMNSMVEDTGLSIRDGHPVLLAINKLVLFPIQVVDPLANWSFLDPKRNTNADLYTKLDAIGKD